MGIPHGNINPKSIFIAHNNVIKLAESTLIPGLKSGYQRYLSLDENVCLSPEQLACFRKGNTNLSLIHI